jgi:uncharacterized protein (DUF885 family)
LTEPPQDECRRAFDALAEAYLDASLALHPTRATAQGYHHHDGRLEDLSEGGVRQALATYRDYLVRLDRVGEGTLDLGRRIDLRLIRNDIRSALFEMEELRSHRHDPTVYNDILGFSTLFLTLLPDGAPEWPERLASLGLRLRAMPDFLATARANLKDPSPVLVDYVIDANRSNLQFLSERAPRLWRHAPDREGELEEARCAALEALRSYQRWLERDLRPRCRGDWRLGREMWERKLRFQLQSDLTPEEIARRAVERIREERHAMLELAEPLHERLFPHHHHRETGEDRIPIVVGEVIRKISERHSSAASLLGDVQGHIRRIVEFLRRTDFVTLPPEDDGLVVEPTPGFLGGLAVAFFNPPPAFEPHLKKSFWISSVEGRPADFVESYLREYNDYAMQSLTIHEAFPGHYVQFWHALNSPVASIYKKVLASNTFAEGWAVLCERLLFAGGYAEGEPENLLIHKKIHLRSPMNALLDQRFHTAGRDEADDAALERWAMDLMCGQGFQEEAEARGKVRRAQVSSTQLSTYFVGYLELEEIHRRARETAGEGFRPREFHDRLLSFGTIPPPEVRRLLEQDGVL